ncbi:MAG TPA: DCC1-like thiol-disulfide oxidoreductase family protein [Opitutaceae bacterium]|nr:DCC1-like thiol-disulfide oxidoreductase family protein [Opitutaceae bacterium]
MPARAAIPANGGPVLFFDGECGLCNRIVRILLRLDRHGRLRLAPLQGPNAQAYLAAHGLPREDFDSLIFVPDWARRDRAEFLVRTDGVIGALRAIGGACRVLAWGSVVPAGWRDAAYKLVARWRYRLFGVWRPKPLPRPEWTARFLE